MEPNLCELIRLNASVETIKEAIDAGMDVNQISNHQYPLKVAIYYNRIDLCRLFIDRGADVNWQQDVMYTPLTMAAIYGSVDIAHLLLSKGADPDHLNGPNDTPALYFAF
jgi:ankyrin repeat protein